MLFGLIPGVVLGTCIKKLITLSGDDASLVSASRLDKASGQPIPDPSYSWCLRKDPHGAEGGFQGRDQTRGRQEGKSVSLVPVAPETQSSFVLCPGHADSSNNQARALGSPVPPKPSAKQVQLMGKDFKKEEEPSGECRFVCKVGTDCCVHPPLGSARGTRVSCHI